MIRLSRFGIVHGALVLSLLGAPAVGPFVPVAGAEVSAKVTVQDKFFDPVNDDFSRWLLEATDRFAG